MAAARRRALPVGARFPEGFENDSPLYALMDREKGGVTVYVDGLPRMGKTTLLQRIARELIGLKSPPHKVFWWGEPRPQYQTFFPDHYQLLVEQDLELELVRQWPGLAREERVPFRAKTGLNTMSEFYEAADPGLLNVLVFDEAQRADRILAFLELVNRRRGLEHVAVVIDETAKIAPGAAKREDGSYYRGLRLARALEDTGKSHVSVFMSSHFPTDLWYVCLHKVQYHVAFAGQHSPKDRHSREAQNALKVGEFYVNGPTLSGKRYDQGRVTPPPDPGWRLFLRVSGTESSHMGGSRPPPPPKAPDPTVFKCPGCPATFGRADNLRRHLRSRPSHGIEVHLAD
jgi:hypothetical protein